MIGAGVEAVLIKVASMGLDAVHLGKSIAEMRPTLAALHERFGLHVCGEGGEYVGLSFCPSLSPSVPPTEGTKRRLGRIDWQKGHRFRPNGGVKNGVVASDRTTAKRGVAVDRRRGASV